MKALLKIESLFRRKVLNQELRWVCPKCMENNTESVTDLSKVIRTLDSMGKPHRPESYYKRWENKCHRHTKTPVKWGWYPKWEEL